MARPAAAAARENMIPKSRRLFGPKSCVRNKGQKQREINGASDFNLKRSSIAKRPAFAGRRYLPGRVSHRRGDPLLELCLWGSADLARGHFAVLEQHQGRDR